MCEPNGWLSTWKRNNFRTSTGGPVKNVDMILALETALQGRKVLFIKVKGHSGIPENEAADRLADKGMRMALAARNQPYPS